MSNISETDYVRWVQRSLNRLVNAQLTVDGYKSDDYRRGVKTLQMLSPTLRHYCDPNGFKNNLWGSVDQPTQDVIIEWNQTMFGYMTWVQKSLTKIGMYANFPTGVLDSSTVQSIQFFQKQQKLNIDGWVGAKTETALIRAACSEPPMWEVKAPKPWHQNEDPTIWRNRFVAEMLRELDAPTRAPYISLDPTFRRAYRCVLHKAAFVPSADCTYLTPLQVQTYIQKGRDQSDIEILASDVTRTIDRDFRGVYNGYAFQPEKVAQARFEDLTLETLKQVDAGRDRINYANSVLGDLGHMRILYGWWQQAEGANYSVYSCFQKHLRQEYSGPWSPTVPAFLDVLAQARAYANSKK